MNFTNAALVRLCRCPFRVVRGRLRRQKLTAVPVQSEVHVHPEGRDLAAVQEPPGRGRAAARRGPAWGLHHPGASPRKTGPLPQLRCVSITRLELLKGIIVRFVVTLNPFTQKGLRLPKLAVSDYFCNGLSIKRFYFQQ